MYVIGEVLLAVASELAHSAVLKMPKLQDGERVERERLKDGIYIRESVLNGKRKVVQYDFIRKEANLR